MVKEKEGKILFIDDKCHVKVGFESEDGKAVIKMIPVDTLTQFIDLEFGLDKLCVKIKEAHKKLDDIELLETCERRKKYVEEDF